MSVAAFGPIDDLESNCSELASRLPRNAPGASNARFPQCSCARCMHSGTATDVATSRERMDVPWKWNALQ